MPLWVSVILLGYYCLLGCAKEDAQPKQSHQNDLSSKVTAWLDLQKTNIRDSKTAVGKKANIDLVKDNLEFAVANVEQLNSQTDILIIPVKDAVISNKHLDGDASLVLQLYTDKAGRIRSGGLVYFQPADHQPHGHLPQNTFTNLLNKKGTVLNGTYKMLDLTGKWLSQFEVKDGRLSAAGNTIQKQNHQSGQRTAACYDWYLTTVHFYTDGTTETTEVYLGTSCDGCSSTDFATLCPEDPGSGGGGVGSGDEIIEGEDNLEGSSNWLPDPSSGINLSGAGLLPISFSAHVSYNYNRTLGVITNVTGAKPTIIPVSQPFIDDNGDLAAVFYTIGPWNFMWFPLTPGTFYASFSFDLVRTYVFVNGTRVFTFPEGLSKVVNCL